MRWERKNHGASLCIQFASWCADYLLGPITLILINEHATHNLSEEGEKIWHMFGGCSVPAPRSGSAFLKLLGWEWQHLSNWDDTEMWFKPPLWTACVQYWHWKAVCSVETQSKGRPLILCLKELRWGVCSATGHPVFYTSGLLNVLLHLWSAQCVVWSCRGRWGWGHRLAF